MESDKINYSDLKLFFIPSGFFVLPFVTLPYFVSSLSVRVFYVCNLDNPLNFIDTNYTRDYPFCLLYVFVYVLYSSLPLRLLLSFTIFSFCVVDFTFNRSYLINYLMHLIFSKPLEFQFSYLWRDSLYVSFYHSFLVLSCKFSTPFYSF